MLFKYGDRPVVLILCSVQRCLNHRLDLSDSSPSLLYSLVRDVSCMAPVMAIERFLFYSKMNHCLVGHK